MNQMDILIGQPFLLTQIFDAVLAVILGLITAPVSYVIVIIAGK